jgi:hypothetical protein
LKEPSQRITHREQDPNQSNSIKSCQIETHRILQFTKHNKGLQCHKLLKLRNQTMHYSNQDALTTTTVALKATDPLWPLAKVLQNVSNVFIAGGFALWHFMRLILKETQNMQWTPSDIDIWCISGSQDYQQALNMIVFQASMFNSKLS